MAQNPDREEIRLALLSWKNNQGGPFPVVDARPTAAFCERRLCGAAHVPPDGLAERCFLLPDKPEQFGCIVGPCDMSIKECSTLQEFFRTRHWNKVTFYFRDCEELWEVAAELGLMEGPDVPQRSLFRRFMFRPCPLLEEEIERIEASLAASACAAGDRVEWEVTGGDGAEGQAPACGHIGEPSGTDSGSGADTAGGQIEHESKKRRHDAAEPFSVQQLQQQQPQRRVGRTVFRCLEPGCGSARSTAWLLVREPTLQPQLPAPSISGSGSEAAAADDAAAGAGSAEPAAPAAASAAAASTFAVAAPAPPPQPSVQLHASWQATGLDFWYGALARVQDMFQLAGIPPEQADLWFVNVNADSGALEPLPLNDTCKHSAGAGSNTHILLQSPDTLPTGHYDLILCVRFLERAFFRTLPSLLRPGGFVLVNTFLDLEGTRKFGRPKGERHLLQPGELAAMFGAAAGMEVVRDDVAVLQDGTNRELSMFVARKL